MTAQMVDGRYELQAMLGAGGMGEVWRAHDHRLARSVAVKLLNITAPDARLRQRFEREARAAASFSHPNAVTVYDFGEEGDRPYIVMELVEGRSLADVIAERAPLPANEAVTIGGEVLSALGAAHRHGLVHRDVKPGNVLLTPDGRAKLADFGIATTVGGAAGALTATGEVLGTPHYLSPEQVSGKPATPRSDLYATGVMLYEMLTGAPPFTAEAPMAVALAHQRSPVPPLRSRRPQVDPALAHAVERALEKDPEQRYPDAESMRAALTGAPGDAGATVAISPSETQILETEPEPPPPPVTPARRPLWPLVTVLALLALLVIGLALADGDDDPTSVAPSTTEEPAPSTTGRATTSTSPSTTRQTTTTSVATTTSAATTPGNALSAQSVALAAVAQQVASNPQAYGPRGADLARALADVQRANPNQRDDRAEEAIEDIQEWMGDGQLDPGIGMAAIAVLTPFTR
jgi:serine/threonine protein kinase